MVYLEGFFFFIHIKGQTEIFFKLNNSYFSISAHVYQSVSKKNDIKESGIGLSKHESYKMK